jgi:hypothetical protein
MRTEPVERRQTETQVAMTVELTADISEFGRHLLIIHVINVGGK